MDSHFCSYYINKISTFHFKSDNSMPPYPYYHGKSVFNQTLAVLVAEDTPHSTFL